ncbi:DUF418 domain-containing protein [Paractinoplanes lichenicola]|uniref:DUF418 domain-containing protein n=1 Tax=Paractinoplanes lichenicola TaxID=2802976 RepID=A0ABS1VFJ7_9ACTN|nr:DUF418 domain-containing protein [Actinoplanes lichenicola]MBL7253477.1 DUF418 domain-containing protein [Actinoplanes lichenicola]
MGVQRTHTARITAVDALRGVALLGILVVNIAFFASGDAFHHAGGHSPTRDLVHLLFEMKFYLLFSFLFGYSFTLQIDSAARAGARFGPRILRRCAGLFALGALHAVLFFYGDILTTYAVLGLVLLAVHRIGPRAALLTGATLTAVVGLAIGIAGLTVGSLGDPDAAAQARAMTDALAGSPASVIGLNLATLPDQALSVAVQAPLSLAAFLAGLAAGKTGFLVTADPATLRRIQLAGFPISLAGAALFTLGGGTTNLLGLAASILTAPLLTAAYVAALLSLFRTTPGARLAAWVAPAGRMALTNYLSQSVVCALIFTGWGLALAGELPPRAVLLTAAVIFVAQVLISRWWLRDHRYGPAERLLRLITNAERRPASEPAPNAAPPGAARTHRPVGPPGA